MANRAGDKGKFHLEIPLDATGVGELGPEDQQDLRVVVRDATGATRSAVVSLGKERRGSAGFDFKTDPGGLSVHVGSASATDEELLQSQTLKLDVSERLWAKRPQLTLQPILIAPYWWFWWLRWCREFIIRGRVVCPDGDPVPGAEVCAFDVTGGSCGAAPSRSAAPPPTSTVRSRSASGGAAAGGPGGGGTARLGARRGPRRAGPAALAGRPELQSALSAISPR